MATGSAAFVIIGALMSEEPSPTRIAAQVASGVGFLGAGVILREGFSVRGLDTAATLWCSAAVGSLAGLGFHAAAAMPAVAVIATNLCLRPLGRLIDRRQDAGSEVDVEYRISVTCAAADETHVRALLLHAVATEPLTLRGVRAHRGPGSDTVRIEMMVMSDERDVYISEISLYDLRKNRLVWSGTVKTDAPRNIDKAINQYVKTIVKALERDGVLAGA